jgi:hypothetical protein
MSPTKTETAAPAPRRPARDIIDAVVDNMRKNLEPLKYSTLAPSRYVVYLHAGEFARLEGIVPILQEQTIRALTDELGKLNRRSPLRTWVDRLRKEPDQNVRQAGADWQVEFLPDPDGDMSEGDLLIDSELVLPASPDLGVGERPPAPAAPAPAVFARIQYSDDAGPHSFEVVKDSITIGRGGLAYPVDIRISSSADVSREHARLRRDPATGRFYIIDLSSLGTTLNGRHVPRGVDEVDGAKRENGAETALPDTARIGLADTVFLDFGAVR